MDKSHKNERPSNLYDDSNIPKENLSQDKNDDGIVEPLPESTRPRKDGPGGN